MTSELSTATRARPPTVLQVLPRLVSGGVERGTVEIAQALTAAGWRAIVASEGGPMAAELVKAGALHVTLPLAAKNPLTMRCNAGRIAELVLRERIDIVHARSRAPAWSAWWARQRTPFHFVTTLHNAYRGGTRLKTWYNSVMSRGERVIAISAFVADYARGQHGVGEDRLRLIHRGVDIGRFDPERVSAERMAAAARQCRIEDGAPVILLPGRLSRWKGQALLVDAVRRLGRRDLRCIFLGGAQGSGGYRRELERAIAASGLDGVFVIVDDCRDVPAAYMLADVVVSASTEPEGFGRVVVEGQAMGRPVIASDHGGARETVLPGETGWLVPPGDADALAAALAEALALAPEARVALAARAIAHVRRHFTAAAMCQATLGVYEELLRSRLAAGGIAAA